MTAKDFSDFTIESVEEMMKGFEDIEEKSKRAQAKLKGVSAIVNPDDILETLKRPIAKFGERGAHIIVPKTYQDHQATIIVSKKKINVNLKKNKCLKKINKDTSGAKPIKIAPQKLSPKGHGNT